MKDIAEDVTRRLLADAGVREGMRVLDIGCGRGDVSFIAAGLVGDAGEVLGLDRDEAAIEDARARAREHRIANVRFAQADIGWLGREHGTFDAVVGRRVMMYQPDAVAVLARLADVLEPDGIIVLQEHDSTSMPICRPAMPLHKQVSGWIWGTMAREGANTHMGLNLGPALAKAGYAVERVRGDATVLTPNQTHAIAAIVRAMQNRIVRSGVATADEMAVDTLDERLAAERRAANGSCIWDTVFGAWGHKTA
jgi:cyclopropane fatty-acyl-phospholipid synthase-like methyltransferase